MITNISHIGVFVLDQERALDFYTNKLGFEVCTDAPMRKFRWLTVSPKNQPEIEIILMPISDELHFDKESAEQMRAFVKKGLMGGPVLECDNIYATYEELKSKGVEFKKPPTKEFLQDRSSFQR